MKKAVSSVVAISLFIVVTVATVVGFQTWYNSYASEIFGDIEGENNSVDDTGIQTIIGNDLFIKNSRDENISITNVKIGDSDCSISTNITTGISSIDLSTCAINISSGVQEVVIITSDGVLAEEINVKDAVTIEAEGGDSYNVSLMAGTGSYNGTGSAWNSPDSITADDDVNSESFCSGSQVSEGTAMLIVSDVITGNDQSGSNEVGSAFTYGNSSDNWGAALTPAVINSADFGFAWTITDGGTDSANLKATDFGFSIPGGATIDGVQVYIDSSTSTLPCMFGEVSTTVDFINITVFYTN